MENFKITRVLLLLTLVFSVSIEAQFIDQDKPDWVQIVSANKELKIALSRNFSVLVDKEQIGLQDPKNPQELDELKRTHSISAYQGGTSMWIESYETENADKAFPLFVKGSRKIGKVESSSSIDSQVREFIYDKDFCTIKTFFHYQDLIFVIGAAARNNNNAVLKGFLEATSFRGRNFRENRSEPIETKKGVMLESLAATKFPNADGNLTNKSSLISPMSKLTSDASGSITIIENPLPRYSEAARNVNLKVAVIAIVTFGGNGQIKNIEITKSLGFGLDQQAIKAARRIRFLPAQLNGTNRTVSKRLKCTFSSYSHPVY